MQQAAELTSYAGQRNGTATRGEINRQLVAC
jgi:hypothetical protein